MNTVHSDHVRVHEHWAEYFGQLYQVFPSVFSLNSSDVAILLPDPPITEDPPTLTEVREAISKLKCGKDTGTCDIPAELLKAGDEPMAYGLHTVLAAIW